MAAAKKPQSKSSAKENKDSKETKKGSFLKELLLIFGIVAVIGILLFAISGTWPALVAIESASMEPNIMTYALAFVVEENRFGGWQTQEDAIASGSAPVFNGYGDVIVYKPNGRSDVTPIIHRAIKKISAEEAAAYGFAGPSAHEGTITKGDNNRAPDQGAILERYGHIEPVKDEWIVGKAVFAIPLIGWIPLNLLWCVLIVVAIIIVVEVVTRLRGKK